MLGQWLYNMKILRDTIEQPYWKIFPIYASINSIWEGTPFWGKLSLKGWKLWCMVENWTLPCFMFIFNDFTWATLFSLRILEVLQGLGSCRLVLWYFPLCLVQAEQSVGACHNLMIDHKPVYSFGLTQSLEVSSWNERAGQSRRLGLCWVCIRCSHLDIKFRP